MVTAINENYKVQAGIDDDDGPCVEPAGGEQQAGERYAVFTDDQDAVCARWRTRHHGHADHGQHPPRPVYIAPGHCTGEPKFPLL